MTAGAIQMLLMIAVLALCGVVVSSVSLSHHYSTSTTSFCNFGETMNCDVVNRSIYSTVLGIPVALIGILGYAGLLVLAMWHRAKGEKPMLLLLTSVAGLSFALYLTYIEGFVLGVWCILCLSSLGLIVTITALSSTLAAQAMWRASSPDHD